MKCNVTIRHVAGVPGYQKIYLAFAQPNNGLERLLISLLDKPRYVAGREPKYSLYVGEPEPLVVKGRVARAWSPSYRKFSWQRFWKQLRTENPSYAYECRCGIWNKSPESMRSHAKNCLVLREFKDFLARVENTKAYEEYIRDGRKSYRKADKKHQKEAEAARAKTKRRQRTSKTVGKTKEKVARRRARKH